MSEEKNNSPLIDAANESKLPDHLLSETSLVKRQRYNNQMFTLMLEKMFRHLEIIIQVERWKVQNKYQETLLKEMMRVDEMVNFFKMLGEINRTNHEKIIKLSVDQLIELQQRLEKINMIKSVLSEKILQLSAQISKVQNEIQHLNIDLDNSFSNYKKFFVHCFNDNANYQNFKPINIPCDLNERGNIYIDEDKYKVIGKAIADAISKQDHTAELDKVIKNAIELNISDQISPKNAQEEYQIESVVKKISDRFHQHMQVQTGYEDMLKDKTRCNVLQTEINQKKIELSSAQDNLNLHLQHENALDEIANTMQEMVQKRECNKDIHTVLNASCDSSINEIFHKIDRQEKPKVEEDARVSMRMR